MLLLLLQVLSTADIRSVVWANTWLVTWGSSTHTCCCTCVLSLLLLVIMLLLLLSLLRQVLVTAGFLSVVRAHTYPYTKPLNAFKVAAGEGAG